MYPFLPPFNKHFTYIDLQGKDRHFNRKSTIKIYYKSCAKSVVSCKKGSVIMHFEICV